MTAKTVTIEFDEASLRRFYKRIDPQNLIADPVDSFLNRVADDIAAKARHGAPVDTGKLRDSIRKVKSKNEIAVVVDVPYAVYVHEGTRPHWPPVSALQGWADRHGVSAYAVAAGIAKHGTRSQPFLSTAVEKARRSLPLELQRAAKDIETEFS